MTNLAKLQKNLRLTFKNQGLCFQAFTHRSYLNEQPSKNLVSNERLEFLGDSILSFTVAKFFYHKFKQAPEGKLTTLRAQTVQTKTLAMAAKELQLGNYLLLSKGEERSGGRNNETLLANTFEALVGAIFLDQGLQVAEDFTNEYLLKKQQRFGEIEDVKDYKSMLQRTIQDKIHLSPIYKTIYEQGPDHSKTFEVAVYAASKQLGKGSGKSKQQAQQQAAKNALESNGLK